MTSSAAIPVHVQANQFAHHGGHFFSPILKYRNMLCTSELFDFTDANSKKASKGMCDMHPSEAGQ